MREIISYLFDWSIGYLVGKVMGGKVVLGVRGESLSCFDRVGFEGLIGYGVRTICWCVLMVIEVRGFLIIGSFLVWGV